MNPTCPKCQSDQIGVRNYGKKAGAFIGTVAGAVSVATGVWRGAEIGAIGGTILGPAGITVGIIAGAVLGGLTGGTAGAATGVKLGEYLDTHLFNNYQCLECGHKFSATRTSPEDVHADVQRGTYPYRQENPSGFGPVSHGSHEREEDFP